MISNLIVQPSLPLENKTLHLMQCLIDICMDTLFLYCVVESFCGPAPLVENGYIVNSTGVYGGDKVTYSCKNGYSTTQSMVIMCRSNGVWGTVPSCQGQCIYLSKFIFFFFNSVHVCWYWACLSLMLTGQLSKKGENLSV